MWVLYLIHFLFGFVMFVLSIDIISFPYIYIGGLVWFAINQYNIKRGVITSRKAFIIPTVLIAVSIVLTILYEGFDTNFHGTTLFLYQLIIYVLCYVVKFIFKQLAKCKIIYLLAVFAKKILAKCLKFYWILYLLHWLAGGAFIALDAFFINVKYNTDIVLIIGYVEMLIGGFVWCFLNKYAEKHSGLSKKQLFIIPTVLMLTTAVSGLFIKEEGDYFPWLGKFVVVFPQIVQFAEYIMCYYIAEIIRLKSGFIKRYYWTLYLLHWLIAEFLIVCYLRDIITIIEMVLGGIIWYMINYYTLMHKDFNKKVVFLVPIVLMLTLMLSLSLVAVPLLELSVEDIKFAFSIPLFQMVVYIIISVLGYIVKLSRN